MHRTERAEVRKQLGLKHAEMGLVLGFKAVNAETLSERREMAETAAGFTQTRGSEAILIRLLGDKVVTAAQCLARSDEPAARVWAEVRS